MSDAEVEYTGRKCRYCFGPIRKEGRRTRRFFCCEEHAEASARHDAANERQRLPAITRRRTRAA